MRLDSARELKHEIMQTLATTPAGLQATRAVAVSAVSGMAVSNTLGFLAGGPTGAIVGAAVGGFLGASARSAGAGEVGRDKSTRGPTPFWFPRSAAVGLAPRGSNDYHLAVRVQSRGFEQSGLTESIRKKAKGEIDVRYIGRVEKRTAAPWPQRRMRPVRIGSSIGHHAVTAGTLTALLRDRRDGTPLLLSNNHVLANENRARKGDAILQPGRLDGGETSRDTVAKLRRFVRLDRARPNFIDGAVAEVRSDVEFESRGLRGIGRLRGVAEEPMRQGARVAKLGRTTGLTRGRVTAIEVDFLTVEYDLGWLRFDGLLEIEGAGRVAFSDGGDSGALIVDADVRALGLLFSGSDQGGHNGKGLTYAHPMRDVLDALDADLLL